jgi:hypothetical protein
MEPRMEAKKMGNRHPISADSPDPYDAALQQYRRDLVAVFGESPVVDRYLRWVIRKSREQREKSLATDCLHDFLTKARAWQQAHNGDVRAGDRGEGYWFLVLRSTYIDLIRRPGTTSRLASPNKNLLRAIQDLTRLHMDRTQGVPDAEHSAERRLDELQPCLQTVLREAAQPQQTTNAVALISLVFRMVGNTVAGSDLITLQQTLIAAPRTWRDFQHPAPSDNQILAHLSAYQQLRLEAQQRNPVHLLQDLRRRFYDQCVARYQWEHQSAKQDAMPWVFVRWLLTARTDAPRIPRLQDQLSLQAEGEAGATLEQFLSDGHDEPEYLVRWLTAKHAIRVLLLAALEDTATVRGLVVRTCIASRLGFAPRFGADLAMFRQRIAARIWSPWAFDYEYSEDDIHSFLGSVTVRLAYPHLTELRDWIGSDSGHRVRRQRSQFVTAVAPRLAIQHGFEPDLLKAVALWLLSPRARGS